jgi:DNA polymerase-3 subunit delta'
MLEEYLKKALAENKLPNTMLFSGSGKKTALWLAATLLKTDRLEHHPDYHPLVPEGKAGLHPIETIRNAIGISHSAPFSAPAKVFLIESAESMQPASANALLKTLEEPVLDSYWILLSERPQEILPTILSRCAKLSFQSQESEPQTPEYQESKAILLSLINERPSYPKLFLSLERVGDLMEEKDPAPLFVLLAHAFRDLEFKGLGRSWQEPFEQARLGVERNIKLATCLENFFLSLA